MEVKSCTKKLQELIELSKIRDSKITAHGNLLLLLYKRLVPIIIHLKSLKRRRIRQAYFIPRLKLDTNLIFSLAHAASTIVDILFEYTASLANINSQLGCILSQANTESTNNILTRESNRS